ncbi:Uncharacterised protein [Streptococcus suis]|nr:Uncharacterised protein [Streptococcus suis]
MAKENGYLISGNWILIVLQNDNSISVTGAIRLPLKQPFVLKMFHLQLSIKPMKTEQPGKKKPSLAENLEKIKLLKQKVLSR